MSSSGRISKAYASSPQLRIDDQSKIVLISDCHRGDGSWADAFAGNRNLFTAALEAYNREKFTYIELGDGDELWENKSFSDILGEYKALFRLLSRFYVGGRLHLLYGNHDIVKRDVRGKNPFASNPEFKHLFPGLHFDEGLVLNYYDIKLFLVHGHQADFFNSELWRLGRFLVRHVWRRLESLGVNDPTSASKNHRKKTAVETALMQWAEEHKILLFAGHTHRTVFPPPGGALYFNDGSCVSRDYISAIELEGGVLSLVNWRFKVREDGTLYVGRDVLVSSKLRDYLQSQ